jgi:hypothetical protein
MRSRPTYSIENESFMSFRFSFSLLLLPLSRFLICINLTHTEQ